MKIYIGLKDDNFIDNISIERNRDDQIELEIENSEINNLMNNFENLKYENNNLIISDSLIEKNKLQKLKKTKYNQLKKSLENTDYKIIKCYEAFMRQLPMPYNLEELCIQRDAWRAEINELEQELNNL